jgi:hypothetical protein
MAKRNYLVEGLSGTGKSAVHFGGDLTSPWACELFLYGISRDKRHSECLRKSSRQG